MPKDEKKGWKHIASLPRLTLTDRQRFDVEMLVNGGFAPLEGFLNEDDYTSVVAESRLVDGSLWPIPIVLDIDAEHSFSIGNKVLLCDVYGNPLALLTIESIYSPDKVKEVLGVYGTDDETHPGVSYILNSTGQIYLGGKVEKLGSTQYYDYSELRMTPQEVKRMKEERKIKNLVGFQTRNPLHKAHFELMHWAAQETGGHVLIHPVVGTTKPGDIDYRTRVKAYKHVHEKYAQDFTLLSLLPLSMRMAGPREALWHALIRKNYGCTHFVIGRDHAGPGKNAKGEPFYGLYEAQDFVNSFGDELGITVLTSPEIVYSKKRKGFIQKTTLDKDEETLSLSGTEFRKRMRNNESIPSWFSFPEVIEELRNARKRENGQGMTIFLTGLSGAGKSTIAQILKEYFETKAGRVVSLLDGDVIRKNLSKGLTFSRGDRETNVERIGYVASEITKHGGIVICAAIAPHQSVRKHNRRLIESVGRYIEVYVATSFEECKRRDTKGLYEKALNGEIDNFTGVNDVYEEPQNAELMIDTQHEHPEESVKHIIDYLKNNVDDTL